MKAKERMGEMGGEKEKDTEKQEDMPPQNVIFNFV